MTIFNFECLKKPRREILACTVGTVRSKSTESTVRITVRATVHMFTLIITSQVYQINVNCLLM